MKTYGIAAVYNAGQSANIDLCAIPFKGGAFFMRSRFETQEHTPTACALTHTLIDFSPLCETGGFIGIHFRFRSIFSVVVHNITVLAMYGLFSWVNHRL